MQTPLLENEKIIKEGFANLQKNLESVGGRLYLTNHRLIFEAHQLNIQGGTTEINLSNIQSIHKCWTKFLDRVPVFPNALSLMTANGSEYRFTLYGRKKWSSAIRNQQEE